MRGHIAEKNGRFYPVISIKDPGTGKWRRKWLTGNPTKRKAERALTEAIGEVNKGMLIMPSRETVATLCRNYLETIAPNRVRPITLNSYHQMLETHVIPKVGAKPAVALTPDDLNLIMANMVKAGKSATTTRYLLRIVHLVLDDALRKGKLVRNVAELADPPAARKADTEVWDMQELDHFLTAAGNSEFYALFATMALTGVRRGEALGLKWGDMDLNNTSPNISIRRTAYKIGKEWRYEEPKTKRSRRIVALPLSLAMLLRYLHERQESNAEYFGGQLSGDDFVFTREDGTLPDPGYVSKVFRRIVKNSGLKRIRLHDLRHTYATLQRKAGQPIEVISRVLGHASEMVTLTIYNHWEGELRAAADTMDLMLEKISQNENKEASVRNPLANGEGSECRPYRSRTCDTLIKSQVLNLPQFWQLLRTNSLEKRLHF